MATCLNKLGPNFASYHILVKMWSYKNTIEMNIKSLKILLRIVSQHGNAELIEMLRSYTWICQFMIVKSKLIK